MLFVIIAETAYHVLFIDARNFWVCLWLIASRAEAVGKLITKRKRWMIKALIYKYVSVCVSLVWTIVNARIDNTSIRPEVRVTPANVRGISERRKRSKLKKKIICFNFQFVSHDCMSRWTSYFFFNNLPWSYVYLSRNYSSEKIELE